MGFGCQAHTTAWRLTRVPTAKRSSFAITNCRRRANQLARFGWNNEKIERAALDKFYDAGSGELPCLGGTTTLVYDTKTQTLEKHFLSLVGTIRNCAGGLTPWGTWITCEETMQKADSETTYEVDHGYNFEVPVSTEIGLTDPIPLKAMGRFNHEAVAVDPKTGIVYQTEDRGDSLIYRFIPDTPGELAAGGKLQALKIRDLKSADTRNWQSRTQKVFRWMYNPVPVGETLRSRMGGCGEYRIPG